MPEIIVRTSRTTRSWRLTIGTVAAGVVLATVSACQPIDTAAPSGGTDTSKPLVASAAQASHELSALQVAANGSISGYVRDDFKTWDSQGGGCDTRDVVLKRDGSGVKVEGECKIVSGTWVSPYNQKTYHSAQDLQIDHLVPLGDAWESGAKDWSASKKEAYANDLKDPLLLAVDVSDNESKGDDDPSGWKPPNHGFWCTYAKDWISVKSVWGLTVTTAEKSALNEMLHTCS
jgi:Protein of unknown function (DUF1524)